MHDDVIMHDDGKVTHDDVYIIQHYYHYIIQQVMKMNIFLCKRNLFRKTAEKAIFLDYDVINDVMMMQCIYQ